MSDFASTDRPLVPAAAGTDELLHVAIIMDGNGRWAQQRGLPRAAGHRQGAEAARGIIEAAAETNIGTLTLFALSRDNFARPPMEVARILALLKRYAVDFAAHARRSELRLEFVGSRERLPSSVVAAMRRAEASSAPNAQRALRIAVDYSARGAIETASALEGGSFDQRVNRAINSHPETPPVDLLIRSGGERRLSDFMLWEAAWAELYFSDSLWPDFTPDELRRAIASFAGRDRRYGRV